MLEPVAYDLGVFAVGDARVHVTATVTIGLTAAGLPADAHGKFVEDIMPAVMTRLRDRLAHLVYRVGAWD